MCFGPDGLTPARRAAFETRRIVAGEAVARLTRVTMLPRVTLRIVELIDDRDYDTTELEKLVATDPALCLRMLKVVNSAFYGNASRVGSIRRAIVVLGGPAIRNIALATSLGRMLQTGDGDGPLSAHCLWRHSLAVAAGAKLVAASCGEARTDEAMIAGLLHDVGILVEFQGSHREKLPEVAARCDAGASIVEAEIAAFGATHHDFGQALAERWRLPPRISEVIGCHHAPSLADESAVALSSIVHVADGLAHRSGLGFGGTAGVVSMEEALDRLRLGEDEVERVAGLLPGAVDELEQALA